MLTEAQIRAAENGLDPTNQAGARGLTRRGQWPGGVVPYTIHSSASMKLAWKSAIYLALFQEREGALKCIVHT